MIRRVRKSLILTRLWFLQVTLTTQMPNTQTTPNKSQSEASVIHHPRVNRFHSHTRPTQMDSSLSVIIFQSHQIKLPSGMSKYMKTSYACGIFVHVLSFALKIDKWNFKRRLPLRSRPKDRDWQL